MLQRLLRSPVQRSRLELGILRVDREDVVAALNPLPLPSRLHEEGQKGRAPLLVGVQRFAPFIGIHALEGMELGHAISFGPVWAALRRWRCAYQEPNKSP